MENYEQQGKDFLKETETTINIMQAVPQKSPNWIKEGDNHGIHYSVTLKNERGEYVFNFWGSIEDRRTSKRPLAYDVLACLDPLFEDNFEDFCDSYGYDSDSIRALKIFEACQEQERGLKRIFTEEQLQKLSDIQ